MNTDFSIRKLDEAELPTAMRLAWRSFLQFEAPSQSEEGIRQFEKFVTPEAATARAESGESVTWGAYGPEGMVGMVSFSVPSHINLLFVDGNYQRQGIGRQLMDAAFAHARLLGVDSITVNSSVYGLEAYKHFGFVPTAEETVRDGITFIPMEIKL